MHMQMQQNSSRSLNNCDWSFRRSLPCWTIWTAPQWPRRWLEASVPASWLRYTNKPEVIFVFYTASFRSALHKLLEARPSFKRLRRSFAIEHHMQLTLPIWSNPLRQLQKARIHSLLIIFTWLQCLMSCLKNLYLTRLWEVTVQGSHCEETLV